jgi:ricin-type beta-trefoil lectin protein
VKRIFASVAVAIVMALAAAAAPAAANPSIHDGSAEVSPARARHYFKSPTTGRCLLGGQLTGSGTGWVGTWPCEPSWWLVWDWYGQITPHVWSTIRGVPEGSCLDSNTAGDVYMLSCNGGPYQYWRVFRPDTGLPVIQDYATGLCLSEPASGGAAYTAICDASNPKQRWRIVSHPAQ